MAPSADSTLRLLPEAAASTARAYAALLRAHLGDLPFEAIGQAAAWMDEARERGRTLFVFGNGGGAATASHLACDLGKGASQGRSVRFRVRSLGENRAWATALANDLGYEQALAEELENFAAPGDLCLALSASGASPNVLAAVRRAREMGARVVALVGRRGEALATLADLAIMLPDVHPGRVEDLQLIVCHMIGYHLMDAPSPPRDA